VTQGETIGEAIAMAKDAIRLYIEGTMASLRIISIIITAYQPTLEKWEADMKVRRKQS
jgi:predicted RNase H-like HicB family nuclease